MRIDAILENMMELKLLSPTVTVDVDTAKEYYKQLHTITKLIEELKQLETFVNKGIIPMIQINLNHNIYDNIIKTSIINSGIQITVSALYLYRLNKFSNYQLFTLYFNGLNTFAKIDMLLSLINVLLNEYITLLEQYTGDDYNTITSVEYLDNIVETDDDDDLGVDVRRSNIERYERTVLSNI